MAEPTEGTYVLVAAHSKQAMDVAGATDGDVVNVRQFTRNDTDAQIWALVKMGSYWQIFCSLTGKCLDIAGNNMADGTNIRQYQDNNTAAQRWSIVDTGSTMSYNGTTYPLYRINASSNSSKVIDVSGNNQTVGANIMLHTWNGGNNQKWILVPKPTLSEVGAYQIVSATDETDCVAILNSSTANDGQALLASKSENLQRTFILKANPENFLTQIINVNSNKALYGVLNDSKGVRQYTQSSNANQRWLLVQFGNMKIDGLTVPTYQIREQSGGGSAHGFKVENTTKLMVRNLALSNGQLSGPADERFAFVKTDIPANNIAAPGKLSPASKSRTGLGDVVVSGLKFASNETKFQARYMVRSYSDTKKTAYTDSAWMNLSDDSTSRSGWGAAWSPTFTATPADGKVTLPFNKTFTLTENVPFIDVFIEVRVFKSNYISGGYTAFGTKTQTKISLIQNPTVDVSSVAMNLGSETSDPVLTVSLDSSFNTCQYTKARVYDEDGAPLSDWKSAPGFNVELDIAGDLYRLPENGENITIMYEMVTDTSPSTIVKGSATTTFSYISGAELVVGEQTGDDGCLLASRTSNEGDRCFMLIDYVDGSRYIECPVMSYTNGVKTWKVMPPLNTDTTLAVFGVSGSTYTITFATCRANSHLFMWNWNESDSNEPYDKCAGVLINSDAPPAQTRTYKTDISFQAPTGRRLPVAFSGRNIDATYNVEGVVVDEDANYIAAAPIPDHTTIKDLRKLISLSGKGIHPIYRSPYGDWATVGIESVDLSKTELGLSSVKVTQRAVED